MQKQLLILAAAVLLLANQAAEAQQVNLQGYLIALSDCQANKKKDSDNPGNVRLERLHAYEMIARNATPGTHYQVKVPGAPETDRRWVAMSCGAYAPKSALVIVGSPPATGPRPEQHRIRACRKLAAGLLRHIGRPGQGGMRVANRRPLRRDAFFHSRPVARRSRRQANFPLLLRPRRAGDVRRQPGSRYQHRPAGPGPGGPDGRDARRTVRAAPARMAQARRLLRGRQDRCRRRSRSGGIFHRDDGLLEQLNASPVQALFEENIGEVLSKAQIEAAFDAAYGAGAGDRVLIRCSNASGGRIITELWIGLKGDIAPSSDIGDLISAAPPTETSTNASSCDGGRVVEVDAN